MEIRKIIIIGRNTLNTLGQLRSFGEIEANTSLIWVGGRIPSCVENSKYMKECYCVNSHEDAISLLLEKFCDEKLKPIISPDNDKCVLELDNHYDQLKDRFLFSNAGGKGIINRVFEKTEMLHLAEKCGFKIPPTEVLEVGVTQVGGGKIKFPIFTKANWSLDPLWKNATSLCYNKDELDKAYKRMPFDSVIGQNFIEKSTEVFIEGVSVNQGKDVICPIIGQYYRTPKTSYGTYGWIEKTNEEKWHELIVPLRKMIAKIGFEGVFDLQILVGKDNIPWFLEINFRTPVYHHITNKIGVNLCSIWADSMVNGKIDKNKIKIAEKKANFYLEPLDYAWFIRTKKIGLLQVVRDFWTSDCYLLWDKKDIRPVYDYVRQHIFK